MSLVIVSFLFEMSSYCSVGRPKLCCVLEASLADVRAAFSGEATCNTRLSTPVALPAGWYYDPFFLPYRLNGTADRARWNAEADAPFSSLEPDLVAAFLGAGSGPASCSCWPL